MTIFHKSLILASAYNEKLAEKAIELLPYNCLYYVKGNNLSVKELILTKLIGGTNLLYQECIKSDQ